jgi:hypothetical protein
VNVRIILVYICELGDFGLEDFVVSFEFFLQFVESVAFVPEEIELLFESLNLKIKKA